MTEAPRAVRTWGRAALGLGVCLSLGACAEGGVRETDLMVDPDPVEEADAGEPDAGEVDSGVEPKPDAGTTTPDAGPVEEDASVGDDVIACSDSSITCALAVDLGPLSGDTSAASITQTGNRSAFFRLRITEDDHGFLSPKDLGFRVTLSSPTVDFDLYLYAEGDGCTTITQQSTGTAADQVSARWSDNQGFGGEDSSRAVLVEVRPKEGAMCTTRGTWTMSITGNV